MKKVKCPICDNKNLLIVSDDTYIDFDMRKATDKVYCSNCKRWIKFSEVKKSQENKQLVNLCI